MHIAKEAVTNINNCVVTTYLMCKSLIMPTDIFCIFWFMNLATLKVGPGHPRKSTRKRDRSILHIAQISMMPFFLQKSDPSRFIYCIVPNFRGAKVFRFSMIDLQP